MNLFGTVLTNTAPSANYRGESEQNRSVIQRITEGRFEYAVISPEAMRNALRETLRAYGLPCNRERLNDEEQLAVRFEDYPYPERYVDDFFFGYLVANRKSIPPEVVKERQLRFKRDSILRMNLARATQPYRHDAIFTQSPLTVDSPWKNADSSALLHRETSVTAFQYPFALNLGDCDLGSDAPAVDPGCTTLGQQHGDWLRRLLQAIGELNGVAGNHARSYFEMAPASIVLRLSTSLVAGIDTYAFDQAGDLPEVVDAIVHGDIPGGEFYIGGTVARDRLSPGTRSQLRQAGAHLYRRPMQALDAVARTVTGAGTLNEPAAELDV